MVSGTGLVLSRIVAGACWLYFAGLLTWIAVRFGLGDRWSWLFTVNSLASFLFLPVPLVLVAALMTRRWALLVPVVLAGAVWLHFWGGPFLPRGTNDAPEGPRLTVMTYNLLGFSQDPDGVVQTIRDSDADVVGLVELNPRNAAAIAEQLSDAYPYQQLNPEGGVHGSGLISRRPFTVEPSIEDDMWVSKPMIVSIDVGGRQVTFVRFHAMAQPQYHVARERQARKLADYARRHDRPLIVAGDLNATRSNVAYDALDDVLVDAWREAGRGFGNTFPGADATVTPGSSRPSYFGITVPRWLIRIDFIFHSRHWQTVNARNAAFDGASDHRGVIAELVLKP